MRFCGLGACLAGLCEPGAPAQETGAQRFQRLLEERERELAEAEQRREEQKNADAQREKAWEEEMAAMAARRARMTKEELDQDCLSYFATFEVLHYEHADSEGLEPFSRNVSSQDVTPCHGEATPRECLGAAETNPDPLVAKPAEPLEHWLSQVFDEDGGQTESSGGRRGTPTLFVASFGELPEVACEELPRGLADSLLETAAEAEARARSAQEEEAMARRAEEEASMSVALDHLIERYSTSLGVGEGDDAVAATATSDCQELVPRLSEKEVAALTARAHLCRELHGRLGSLLPVLSGDTPSTRLVLALAVLEAGASKAHPSLAGSAAWANFRAPLHALSTADVCWALCSEKRKLVIDSLLPCLGAGGKWLWPDLRRFGVGFWLGGSETGHLIDHVVVRLAQSATQVLKQALTEAEKGGFLVSSEASASSPGQNRSVRIAVDQAVFWYVASGAQVPRLRALLKTGVLRGEPALATLLNHERMGQPDFVRKNAFRLLQLHRHHLAAALFLLIDAMDEACRVAADHLRDLQLALVLTRKRPEVIAPLLRDQLAESPIAARDPWLRVLLAWHAGDRKLVASQASHSGYTDLLAGCGNSSDTDVDASATLPACSGNPQDDGAAPRLFDGMLRPSASTEGLANVARILSEANLGC